MIEDTKFFEKMGLYLSFCEEYDADASIDAWCLELNKVFDPQIIQLAYIFYLGVLDPHTLDSEQLFEIIEFSMYVDYEELSEFMRKYIEEFLLANDDNGVISERFGIKNNLTKKEKDQIDKNFSWLKTT